MMYVCVKFYPQSLFSLLETELNTVGSHKSGNVQQSVKIRSRSENDSDIAEIML